jgi:glycosyltransferase involved in cell wall biosynthesis
MNTPLVSILLCTYNRASFIAQAIESVLTQTFRDWELLILDDASADNTQAVVAQYTNHDPRIHYFQNEKNLGIAANRNQGLALAQGQYLAVLDSDDVWLDQDKLKKQIEFLETHPDHALVGTWLNLIDATGQSVGTLRFETSNTSIHHRLLRSNQFGHSSVLYRLALAREVGGYTPALEIGEDYDLWLKLGRSYKLTNLPEYATAYRVHSESITKRKKLTGWWNHLKLICKYKKDYPLTWRRSS